MTGPVRISPESWEYRLVAAVVTVVDQRVGGTATAPRTRWNGQVLVDTDPDFLGAADDDGNMWVSIDNILEPLRKARDLDRPLTGGEVLEVRDAMATLTHEAVHLLAESGDESAPDAHPFDAAAEADNEGRTEHWTLVNLDGVIHDVFPYAGLEAVEAEVLAETSIDAYPAYTPAARDLDQALAERSGLTSAEVTQKLILADDVQRWNVAVDLVIDERLVKPGLMPEAHRAEVRKQLIAPLHAALSGLEAVEDDESLGDDVKAAAATAAARTAVAGLDTELNQIEGKYQAQQNQSPELARLRGLTDAQAPAAGATKRSPAGTDHAPSEQGNEGRPRGQRTDRPQSPERSS
ncbi:hypothetical protein ACWGID_15220 [Kribbella sp. NPDC054772]